MNLQEKINKLYESGIYDFYVMNDIGWNTIDSLTKDDLKQDADDFSLIQVEILLNDSHGQYIPQKFYTQFDLKKWHIEGDFSQLNNPDNEFYWDDWNIILNNAYCESNGKKWHLYQDGDLFAITYL